MSATPTPAGGLRLPALGPTARAATTPGAAARGETGAGALRLPGLAPNPDGSPWWARVFRITNVRVVSQAFFFALFVFLLGVTWLSRLGG